MSDRAGQQSAVRQKSINGLLRATHQAKGNELNFFLLNLAFLNQVLRKASRMQLGTPIFD